MEFEQRMQLVRRIANGKLYGEVEFNNNTFEVIIKDPTGELNCQADWHYNKILKSYKDQGVFTLEESYGQLIKDGGWTEQDDKKIISFEKDIKIFEDELKNVKFYKEKERALRLSVDKAKEELKKLILKKNQLLLSTAEFLASLAKKRWLISKTTTIVKSEYSDILTIPNFLDVLVVYYYDKNCLPDRQIRELARTDPWRLYWIVSKNTGTPLFGGSSVDMTDLQYSLVFWSKLYDFAFESMDRPTHDIIVDDDKFDIWYKKECDKIESENKKRNIQGQTNDIPSGGEVFIPSDAEGAKEVYAMNDLNAKNRISQREKALIVNNEVREEQLPDVKKDIMIEMVKQGSSK
jgi:hypothetical protein